MKELKQLLYQRKISCSVPLLSLIISVFLVLTANLSFWKSLGNALPFFGSSVFVYASLLGTLIGTYVLVLNIVTVRFIGKGLVALVLLIAAVSSYFMDTYGVHIDRTMLVNVMLTDRREAADYFTAALFGHLFLFALLPILVLALLPVVRRPLKRELFRRLLVCLGCVLLVAVSFGAQYKELVSLFRNHGELRNLINPVGPVRAAVSLARKQWGERDIVVQPIGTDARLLSHEGKPRLLVLVVGETARAMNFGLNGYGRDTTPELRRRGVINFPDVAACGTSTAVSLPCMFSMFPRSEYTERKGKEYENLVDVLRRAGVQVIWRDNDSGGSKGVADRVGEEKLYNAYVEGICNEGGCYDDILLRDIDEKLAGLEPGRDVLLVLHQKGSHGPSYYLRYPPKFASFVPECRSSELQQCTQEEIINTYDNTILYTDLMLSRVMDLLERYRSRYDGAMLYVSDHGESLGEYGLYLHGVPYMVAPDEQTQVPMVMWFEGDAARNFGINADAIRQISGKQYSHDNLFHSVLGLMGVETSVYEKSLDIFASCRPSQSRQEK